MSNFKYSTEAARLAAKAGNDPLAFKLELLYAQELEARKNAASARMEAGRWDRRAADLQREREGLERSTVPRKMVVVPVMRKAEVVTKESFERKLGNMSQAELMELIARAEKKK